MSVSSCPIYGRPCKIADAGAPPPDSGTTDSGTIDSSPPPPVDAGACCPANYTMYACTYPGGGSGFACHNPAMGCASSLTCGQGCDPVVTGKCGTTTNLTWYSTCGCPVMFADAGLSGCPTEGTPCTTKGDTCGGDAGTNCGQHMVCDDHDPKAGGCPISSAKFKENIHYLGDAELAALHDETLQMRLTTYKYQGPWANGSDATHLGFIIEDQPQSLSVDRGHDRVDMYGYVSMVVASMQVQEREIDALRKELAATQKACAKKP
jgi:hypothetical protein